MSDPTRPDLPVPADPAVPSPAILTQTDQMIRDLPTGAQVGGVVTEEDAAVAASVKVEKGRFSAGALVAWTKRTGRRAAAFIGWTPRT